jgi:hypothetical protein
MSQQTTPPSASTAGGNFFEPDDKKKHIRRGILGLIAKGPSEPSAVPAAKPVTQAASPLTTSASNVSKVAPNNDNRPINGLQVKDKPGHIGSHGVEQGRSHHDNPNDLSAHNATNKPHTKEMINGIDAEQYHRLVKEIGTPARLKKPINSGLADKMRKAGWSYRQIAKHFGVSPCTVRRRLREKGLL